MEEEKNGNNENSQDEPRIDEDASPRGLRRNLKIRSKSTSGTSKRPTVNGCCLICRRLTTKGMFWVINRSRKGSFRNARN